MPAPFIAETSLFGWYVGYAIGIGVVLIVVVVVGWIIRSASRIGRQADGAVRALGSATATTLPLWHLADTNRALSRLHAKLRHARASLE
jgi:hypothetical protein